MTLPKVSTGWFGVLGVIVPSIVIGLCLMEPLCAQQFPLREYKSPGHHAFCVAFSPDGEMLASAGSGGAVVWNVLSGDELYVFKGHEKGVSDVTFSPDGSTCATSGRDGTIRLWDLQTGKEKIVLRGHRNEDISCARYSPDGARIVSTDGDALVSWDVAKGRALGMIDNDDHGGAARLAFSPDGEVFAASWAKRIYLRDGVNGRVKGILEGHEDYTGPIAFSPDGATLASGDSAGKVLLWDAQTGARLRVIAAAKTRILSLAFSPDGRILAVGTDDGLEQIRMWDTATGAFLGCIVTYGSEPTAIAYSPDGATLASPTGNSVTLWHARPPFTRIFQGHRGSVYSTAFSPDGKMLASGGADRTVCLWDARTGKLHTKLVGHEGAVTHVAFSTDGSTVVSAADREIRLWDLMMGAPRKVIGGFEDRIVRVTLSPDDEIVATVSNENVHLWSMHTGERMKAFEASLEEKNREYHSVAFSPDGTKLAIGCEGGRVEVRDVASGRIEQVLALAGGDVACVAFEPSGRWLAGGTMNHEDDSITIWDLGSGEAVMNIAVGDESETEFTFSRDGRMIASVTDGGILRVWSTRTGRALAEAGLNYSPSYWGRVAFSPDGKVMSCPGDDNTVLQIAVPLDPVAAGIELAVASFTGNWGVPAGPLTLKVRGKVVTGTFPSYDGRIEGTLSDDRKSVTGRWVQNNGFSGGFELRMSAKGNRIEGSRWSGDHREKATVYAWSGDRVEK